MVKTKKKHTAKKNQKPSTDANDADVLKSYQNEFQLSKTQQIILNIQIEYPELRKSEIAKRLKINPATLSRLINRPNYKKAFAEYHKEARDIILKATTKAAIKYVKLINARKDSDARAVCEGILGDILKEKSSDKQPITINIKFD